MDKNEMKSLIKEAVAEILSERPKPMDILSSYESKVYPVTFYNPAISSFGMSISVARASVQLYMAAPINKNRRGFAQPGEKVYDHDNPYIFGLTIHECFLIQENFDALVNGTWEKPSDPHKPVNEKYKNTMEFQHQSRKFFIGPITDTSNRKTLRVGIYDPERQGSLTYILRPENGELRIFRSIISNAIMLLPFMIALSSGIVRNFKSALYDANNKNKFSQNTSYNNQIPAMDFSDNNSSENPPWEENESEVQKQSQTTSELLFDFGIPSQQSEPAQNSAFPEQQKTTSDEINIEWGF